MLPFTRFTVNPRGQPTRSPHRAGLGIFDVTGRTRQALNRLETSRRLDVQLWSNVDLLYCQVEQEQILHRQFARQPFGNSRTCPVINIDLNHQESNRSNLDCFPDTRFDSRPVRESDCTCSMARCEGSSTNATVFTTTAAMGREQKFLLWHPKPRLLALRPIQMVKECCTMRS